MRRSYRAAAILAVLVLVVTACGGDNGDTDDAEPTDATDDGDGAAAEDLALISEGTLTVCTDSPYPPFEDEDPEAPSGYSGFDIDLMQEVADRLDLTLTVTNTGFDPIESGIAMAGDQCDIAAAAMTILPERQENVLFTDPYFDADQSLLVAAGSGIASLDDLVGESLAVQSRTTGEEYAQENAPEGVEVRSFDNPGDLFTALQAGEVAGILQDLPVNSEAAKEDDSVEVVETFPTGEEYGFAAKLEGKESLVEEVNRLLGEMRDDGTYDEIYDRYFEA